MLNFTDVLFFSATFLALTILRRAFRKKATDKRYPPSLPCLPIVGSLPFMRNFSNVHEFFRSKLDQLGPIFTFKAGSTLILILNSKEAIEEALVKNSSSFAGREMFCIEQLTNRGQKGIISKNFTAEFKRYHKLSLTVLKEFGFGVNRLMETRIQQEFEAMDAFIRAGQGKEFDPSDMAEMATHNIIKNILFGKREEYENGPDEIRSEIANSVANTTVAIEIAPSLLKLVPYFRRKLNNCLKSMARINEILEENIELIKKSSTKVECFVSSYLEKVGPDYDHDQLIHTVRDLIAAGAETTATTLLWALMFIANNPAIQKRLQKEVDEVVPRHRLPSLDDQPKLPFVEATILEVMRIRTLLPLAVPHFTLCDSDVYGYFIPAGTKVFPNLYAVHMDRELWKDPDVFQPERFLDGNNSIIGRDNVISFSLGRRSCLGEVLARQELFLFFAGLMQRFTIQPGKDGQKIDETPVVEFTTKPLPFKVRMIPRET